MYFQLSNQEMKEKEEMHLHTVRCNSNFRNQKLRDSWTCQMKGRDQELQEVIKGNLFIKNLDKSVSSLSLFKLFSSFGEVLDCKVARDSIGLSKGYGFVQYYSTGSARRAIRNLNGTVINGKKVFVCPFVVKEDRESTRKRDSNMEQNQSWEERIDRLIKKMERILCSISDKEEEFLNTHDSMQGLTDEGCVSRVEEKEKGEEDSAVLENERKEVKSSDEEGIVDGCVGAVEGEKDPEREVVGSIPEMHHEPVLGCTSIMGEGEGSKQDDIWKESDMLNRAQTKIQLASQLMQPEPIAATKPVQLAPQAMYLDPQPVHIEQEFMQHGLLLEPEKSKAFNRNPSFQNCPFDVKEQVMVEKNAQTERSLDTGQTNLQLRRDDVVGWSIRSIVSQREGINSQVEVNDNYRSRVRHDEQLKEGKKVTGKRRMKPRVEEFREGYKSKWQEIKLSYFDPGGWQLKHQSREVLPYYVLGGHEMEVARCSRSINERKSSKSDET